MLPGRSADPSLDYDSGALQALSGYHPVSRLLKNTRPTSSRDRNGAVFLRIAGNLHRSLTVAARNINRLPSHGRAMPEASWKPVQLEFSPEST
jgi:hypothetical protein